MRPTAASRRRRARRRTAPQSDGALVERARRRRGDGTDHDDRGPDADGDASADGDADAAFAELVRRHRGSVVTLVRRRTGSSWLGDEIASETFEHAWRSIDELADPDRFRPWLLRIATRQLIDRWRADDRRARREERSDAAQRPLVAGNDPADVVVASSLVVDPEVLRDAIGRLGATHQEVIMLRFHADLSPGEAAEALGITPSAAGVRLHRAVAALRDELTNRGPR